MEVKKIKILESRSDLGAGIKGARKAIDALKSTASRMNFDLFETFPTEQIPDYTAEAGENIEDSKAKYISLIRKTNEHICKIIGETLEEGYFPLTFTGDHGNAAGIIAGIKNKYPDKRLGVIWIDAHADIHSPYTTPSGNFHGMPVAASLGYDNIEDGINKLSRKAIEEWQKMKTLGSKKISPKINPDDIVFIGIRDLEEEEWDLIVEHKIKFILIEAVDLEGPYNIARQTLDYLKNCDLLYISFDVDSLDPSISVGTGTPVENGLSVDQAKKLLKELLNDPKLVAMEVTEINPSLENEDKMCEAVIDILQEVIPINISHSAG